MDPTALHTDNQGAIALAKNPVSHTKSKHIDIRHHFVRDTVMDKFIWLQYVLKSEMMADSLTKALSQQKYEKYVIGSGKLRANSGHSGRAIERLLGRNIFSISSEHSIYAED